MVVRLFPSFGRGTADTRAAGFDSDRTTRETAGSSGSGLGSDPARTPWRCRSTIVWATRQNGAANSRLSRPEFFGGSAAWTLCGLCGVALGMIKRLKFGRWYVTEG